MKERKTEKRNEYQPRIETGKLCLYFDSQDIQNVNHVCASGQNICQWFFKWNIIHGLDIAVSFVSLFVFRFGSFSACSFTYRHGSQKRNEGKKAEEKKRKIYNLEYLTIKHFLELSKANLCNITEM